MRKTFAYFADMVGGLVLFGLIVLTAFAILVVPFIVLVKAIGWLVQ